MLPPAVVKPIGHSVGQRHNSRNVSLLTSSGNSERVITRPTSKSPKVVVPTSKVLQAGGAAPSSVPMSKPLSESNLSVMLDLGRSAMHPSGVSVEALSKPLSENNSCFTLQLFLIGCILLIRVGLKEDLERKRLIKLL